MTDTTKTLKSINERTDELTGTDELLIVDHFGHDVWDTYDHAADPDLPVSRKVSARLSRMMIFVEKVHDGIPAKVAYQNVMAMSVTEVNTYLRLEELYAEKAAPEPAPAGDDDKPVTAEGKDEPAGD